LEELTGLGIGGKVYYVLWGLIKLVAFEALGFCLEVIVSLQQNRDFARKGEGNIEGIYPLK